MFALVVFFVRGLKLSLMCRLAWHLGPAQQACVACAPATKLTKKEKEQLAKLAKQGAGDKKGAGAQGDNNKPKQKAAGGEKPAGSGKRSRASGAEQPLAKTRPRRQ